MNEKRMLNNFLEFVQIDSETKDEYNFMQRIIQYLEKLNVEYTTDDAGSKCGSNGNNIYVKIPGNDQEPILLSSHMDTVKPGLGIKPEVHGNRVVSVSDTILGGDDKAGISIILEAVETILENKLDHRPIEILFTIYEEGGLHGAKNADYSRITAKNALIFDTGGKANHIVNQAPAQMNLHVKVIGRTSHAGVAPEKGINALTVASHAIQNMRLGRIDEETTANIGTVEGGLATNIVMPEVFLKCEARSLNNDKLEAQVKHMVDTFEESAKHYGANVDIKLLPSYQALKTDSNSPFALSVKQTMDKLFGETVFYKAGGGSDANIMNQNGINALICSAGMNKVHTTDEYVDLDIFNDSATFLIEYITKGE